jgi:hypothetical protein
MFATVVAEASCRADSDTGEKHVQEPCAEPRTRQHIENGFHHVSCERGKKRNDQK